ncbi:nucleolar protein 9 [Aplochiton taeniatus]
MKRKGGVAKEDEKNEGGDGEKSFGGAKTRLDPMSVGYFRRVGERLSEGFTEEEEKVMFVENVLTEVKGQAALVALNIAGSITLEQLLRFASPDQVGELMSELGGESGSDFTAVACDRCGGHVVESALRQMPRWTESTSLMNEEEEEEAGGILGTQVLSLSRAVRENCEEFIKHAHGSHVARTLIHVLAGCTDPPRTETTRPGRAHAHTFSLLINTLNTLTSSLSWDVSKYLWVCFAGAKDWKAAPKITDFTSPRSFWFELNDLTASLIDKVNLSVTDVVASATFQTLLKVCHRKRPKLCKKLLKKILAYLTSLSSAPGVSPLLVFLKDQASSRLLEVIFQLSPKALIRDLYKNQLKDQLVTLAIHPIANFPMQRLTAASTNYKMFRKVFDELMEGVEAILAAGHMGVIVQLAESCAQSGERQEEMMQCLLNAFHCDEPGTRKTCCLPLFMSLLTYEVYYSSQTAEGDVNTVVPLTSMCYHGSRLVQALAKFKDRSLLLTSLRSLTSADLLTLGSDPSGSHVLQALITTASDKGRGKILARLKGQYVSMACSRLGSRLLEAVWHSASVSQRQTIAEELVPCEKQLRSDQFARHVWANFALTNFMRKRAEWHEIQTGQSKKKKLFSDILQ